MGPLGPFWPNSMRSKGAQGASPLAPKVRWAHLSQSLTMDPNPPILAKNSKDPIFNQGPPVAHFQPWPLVIPRGHQLSSNPFFSLTQGEDFPLLHAPHTQKMQEGCIYGIIYHYAPFLLSNPMVTFSAPSSMIPNQGTKVHHQLQRRTLQLISLAIHCSYQKTISGPQPPGPLGVGLEILPGLFQGPFSEVIHH
ncbi:hypothetical protein O181_052170 [Austropuccinia psidii MF-1]|uniref:Uncharacterized protein n=1 Tax=Austropuccinia psidii MF-1 TaxID=1389203 RepID=A0A9Q3HSE5_9BASI|nr:hypothetical protein [Austropuccinia psidii MF-1]